MRSSAPTGRVSSVNVGSVRTVDRGGRAVRTAIWKRPVSGPVRVRGVNLDGDDQADRRVHGGPDKAVYAYALEDTAWWEVELGRALGPGSFGENLTTSGIDLTAAVIGERWRIGTSILEVAQPRTPCYKLGIRMGDPRFPARFAAAGRPGLYLRIVTPGEVSAGDAVLVVSQPRHGVTVGTVERAYHADPTAAARLLDAPELPEPWTRWARRVLMPRRI